MANPTVEKLKSIGLRYADKAAVALTALLCLVFVVLAISKDPIETTPEALSEVASQAQQNISRPQDESTILRQIEEDGMVLQDFGTQVASRVTTKVDVRKFSLGRSFVKAEPGAGLIRGRVDNQLLAPYKLVATAGRGGILFADRDEAGNLQPPDPEDEKKVTNMLGMGGMGGYGMSGSGGTDQQKKNVRLEQFKKRQEGVASTKARSAVAGAAGVVLPEDEEEEAAALVEFKTEVRGQRWVAIVGLLNNKTFRERLATALKVPVESPESHPDYRRVELERQQYDPRRGEWSDWSLVNPDELAKLEDEEIAYEEDPGVELTPNEVRLEPIVSFLPFLVSGYWSGVHHVDLIPPEKLRELFEEKEEEEQTPNMAGMMGGMSGMEMMGGMGSGEMMGGMSGMEMMGGMGSGEMGYGMGGMEMMGGMGMGRSAGAGPEHMTEEDIIMIRALDYTVEPKTVYRYHVRVVVANPNYNHDDVATGINNESKEFAGPWSDATDPITVPPDVAVYAMQPAEDAFGPESVRFDVVAWDPNSGSLAVRNFPASPGEFIGDFERSLIAVEGEEEPENRTIDFLSRQLVVDAMGGDRPVQSLALTGNFTIPSVVAMLQPDGSIAIHNQSVDAADDQLAFAQESYRLSISKELNKKSQGNDMGMMGMMGSGGMMGY